MLPIVPHFASECIKLLNIKENEILWPSYDEEIIIDKLINLVVQINGKKRSLLKIERNLSEQTIFDIVKKDKYIEKYLTDKVIKKKIYIQNKLMNIIL